MVLSISQIEGLRSKDLPVDENGEILFKQPWEARAFAVIVNLAEQSYFTWTEWVNVFSKHVERATQDEASGRIPRTYYEQWVDAAEELLIRKGITSEEQLLAKKLGAIQANIRHN